MWGVFTADRAAIACLDSATKNRDVANPTLFLDLGTWLADSPFLMLSIFAGDGLVTGVAFQIRLCLQGEGQEQVENNTCNGFESFHTPR